MFLRALGGPPPRPGGDKAVHASPDDLLAALFQQLDDLGAASNVLHGRLTAEGHALLGSPPNHADLCSLVADIGHLYNLIVTHQTPAPTNGARWTQLAANSIRGQTLQSFLAAAANAIGSLMMLASGILSGEPLQPLEGQPRAMETPLPEGSGTSSDTVTLLASIAKAAGALKQELLGVAEELERSRHLQWLGHVAEALADRVPEPRESPTTAFWRSLVVREAKRSRSATGRGPTKPLPPAPQKLHHLGHLVDDVLLSFPDADLGLLVLLYVLAVTGWTVQLRTSLARSPLATSPWLLVTSPQKQHFIVDLHFRDKFSVGKESPKLARMTRTIPAAFVGEPENLVRAVRWCSSVLEESFATLDLVLPPWRTATHLLETYTRYHPEDARPLQRRVHWALQCVQRATGAPAGPEGSARLLGLAATLLERLQRTAQGGETGFQYFLTPEAAETLISEFHFDAFETMDNQTGELLFEKVAPAPSTEDGESSGNSPRPSYLSQLLEAQRRQPHAGVRWSALQHHVPSLIP